MGLRQIARNWFGSSQQQPAPVIEQEWAHTESLIASGNAFRAANIALFHHDNPEYFHHLLNADRETKLSLIEELNLLRCEEASSMVVRFFRADKINYDENGEESKRRNMVDYLIYHGNEQMAAERLMSMIEAQENAEARAKMIGADKGEVYRAFLDRGFGERAYAVIAKLTGANRTYVMERIAGGTSRAPTADIK